jgi:hypothetical protein
VIDGTACSTVSGVSMIRRRPKRLDARSYTMLTIRWEGEKHMIIGGGAGCYVVYATFDNASKLQDQHGYVGDSDMPSRQVEEFAKILVREVRDAAIRECDLARRPSAQSIRAKHWRKLGIRECESVAEAIIPDCVDTAIFYLLMAIDQEMLRLQFVTADGEVVDLNRDGFGELAGWYVGDEDGWAAMYSEQRHSILTGPLDEATPPEEK